MVLKEYFEVKGKLTKKEMIKEFIAFHGNYGVNKNDHIYTNGILFTIENIKYNGFRTTLTVTFTPKIYR